MHSFSHQGRVQSYFLKMQASYMNVYMCECMHACSPLPDPLRVGFAEADGGSTSQGAEASAPSSYVTRDQQLSRKAAQKVKRGKVGKGKAGGKKRKGAKKN